MSAHGSGVYVEMEFLAVICIVGQVCSYNYGYMHVLWLCFCYFVALLSHL